MQKDIEYIRMPLMGEGVHEATITRWLKEVGDSVTKDEPLLEVSTDKVDTEIVASASGFLIGSLSQPGDVIAVDQVIAVLGPDKTTPMPKVEVSQTSAPAQTQEKGVKKTQAPQPNSHLGSYPAPPLGQTFAGSVRSSPLVRKIAKDHGIQLSEVQGSGLYGRITKTDLQSYMSYGGSRVSQTSTSKVWFEREIYRQKTSKEGIQEFLEGVPVKREKMSKMRLLTASHMTRSVRTSPHVTTTFEVCLDSILSYKQAFEAQPSKPKMTLTTFFIFAAVQALRAFPEANTSIDGDEILFKDEINIGCAVATENGLIVPVLKHCNDLTLEAVSLKLQDIVGRARSKKLQPSDIKGGTFSITNPGIYGSIHSQPIINQPQVAIMSVGAITDKLILRNNECHSTKVCQIGLTFDHRILDGEAGAKFLQHVKKTLENIESS